MPPNNYTLDNYLRDIKEAHKTLSADLFYFRDDNQTTIQQAKELLYSERGNDLKTRTRRNYTKVWKNLGPEIYMVCVVAGKNYRVGHIKDPDFVQKIAALEICTKSLSKARAFYSEFFPWELPQTDQDRISSDSSHRFPVSTNTTSQQETQKQPRIEQQDSALENSVSFNRNNSESQRNVPGDAQHSPTSPLREVVAQSQTALGNIRLRNFKTHQHCFEHFPTEEQNDQLSATIDVSDHYCPSSATPSYLNRFPAQVSALPRLGEEDTATRQLWVSTVGAFPQLVRPKLVFKPDPPACIEVSTAAALATIQSEGMHDIFINDSRVVANMSEKERAKLCAEALLAPLREETLQRNIKVFNIFNHDLEYSIILPSSFGVTALENSSSLVLGITPAGSVTPLHHDMGVAQAITCYGASKVCKILVIFPCTEKNAKIYTDYNVFDDVLLRCLTAGIEGGIVVELKNETTLLIPPGTLHEVQTLEHCILVGADVPTLESLAATARLICYQLKVIETSIVPLAEDIKQYTETATITLKLRRQKPTLQVVQTWLEFESTLLLALERFPSAELHDLSENLVKIWNQGSEASFLSECACVSECPCGKTVMGTFANHFREEHLSQVVNKLKSRGKRKRKR